MFNLGRQRAYPPGRQHGPILEAGWFAHARRKFFELADVEGAARKKSRGGRTGTIYPIALEAVRRFDALFEIERGINGCAPAERLAARRGWLFCGSDRGGERAAILYTLIQTAKLNDVDPQAWLADVLASIANHPAQRLDELLPWNWTPSISLAQAA